MEKKIRYLGVLLIARKVAWTVCVIAGIFAIVESKKLWFLLISAQVVFYSIVVLLCLTTIISAVRGLILSRQQLEATNADCDAGDALLDWLDKNPGKGWSDPTLQKLLRRQIETREHFVEVHKFLTDKESQVGYLKAHLL